MFKDRGEGRNPQQGNYGEVPSAAPELTAGAPAQRPPATDSGINVGRPTGFINKDGSPKLHGQQQPGVFRRVTGAINAWRERNAIDPGVRQEARNTAQHLSVEGNKPHLGYSIGGKNGSSLRRTGGDMPVPGAAESEEAQDEVSRSLHTTLHYVRQSFFDAEGQPDAGTHEAAFEELARFAEGHDSTVVLELQKDIDGETSDNPVAVNPPTSRDLQHVRQALNGTRVNGNVHSYLKLLHEYISEQELAAQQADTSQPQS